MISMWNGLGNKLSRELKSFTYGFYLSLLLIYRLRYKHKNIYLHTHSPSRWTLHQVLSESSSSLGSCPHPPTFHQCHVCSYYILPNETITFISHFYACVDSFPSFPTHLLNLLCIISALPPW